MNKSCGICKKPRWKFNKGYYIQYEVQQFKYPILGAEYKPDYMIYKILLCNNCFVFSRAILNLETKEK